MKVKFFYLCDRKACKRCSYPTCKHTSDVNHAINPDAVNAEAMNFEAMGKMNIDGEEVVLLFEKDKL